MSIYKDKDRGCYVFEFSRVIQGKRIRTRKILPQSWTQAKADAFDREESARLYAVATNVTKPEYAIADAVAKYMKDKTPHLKSGKNIDGELAQMYWAYKGKMLSELPEVCQEYVRKAVKDGGEPLAPATLRNRIRYLTSACRYGWKHYRMCEHDPAERVIVPTVRNERQSSVTRAQVVRLARKCRHKATRAAILIAFYSGMRMDEIRRAKRVEGMFVLDDSKNGRPRHIPMHPKIKQFAKRKLPDQSRISTHFRRVRATMGMDWLHFHDLRHSSASAMINAGVDLYTVGAVLGHKSSQSTKRYSHLATASLKDAIGKIANRGKISPTDKKKRQPAKHRKAA